MKTKIYLFLGLFFTVSLIINACVKNNNNEEDIPVYSNYPEIIYPPDTFKLQMKLKTSGFKEASIKFKENSVWSIVKMTALSSKFWVERQYTDSISSIIIKDTTRIGFEGNQFYQFYGKNNSYPEGITLYVKFQKLSLDYNSFEPKL